MFKFNLSVFGSWVNQNIEENIDCDNERPVIPLNSATLFLFLRVNFEPAYLPLSFLVCL